MIIERIEVWRRKRKWPAQRITDELADLGYKINRRTVTRHLTRLDSVSDGVGSSTQAGTITASPAKSLPTGLATWCTWT